MLQLADVALDRGVVDAGLQGGNELGFELLDDIDGIRHAGSCDANGRGAQAQSVGNGRSILVVVEHRRRDIPIKGVLGRAGDTIADRDLLLRCAQLLLVFRQGLQGSQRCQIGIDANHGYVPSGLAVEEMGTFRVNAGMAERHHAFETYRRASNCHRERRT